MAQHKKVTYTAVKDMGMGMRIAIVVLPPGGRLDFVQACGGCSIQDFPFDQDNRCGGEKMNCYGCSRWVPATAMRLTYHHPNYVSPFRSDI